MVARSSMRTKRHGWLLKCEGAIAAASTSIRWCSGRTGSGRNGPLVVRRLLRTSKNSKKKYPLEEQNPRQSSPVAQQSERGEHRVPEGPRPDQWQQGVEHQHRRECPAIRLPRQKPTATARAAEAKTRKKSAWWSHRKGRESTNFI